VGEEARVVEEHMMQLVHHEEEEVGVGLAVLLDEAGVYAQNGPSLTADTGGGHLFARFYAEELEERAEGVAARGDGVEDAADEGVGFGSHRFFFGKKRMGSCGSASEGSRRRDGR
jgi:hypothetical protein